MRVCVRTDREVPPFGRMASVVGCSSFHADVHAGLPPPHTPHHDPRLSPLPFSLARGALLGLSQVSHLGGRAGDRGNDV